MGNSYVENKVAETKNEALSTFIPNGSLEDFTNFFPSLSAVLNSVKSTTSCLVKKYAVYLYLGETENDEKARIIEELKKLEVDKFWQVNKVICNQKAMIYFGFLLVQRTNNPFFEAPISISTFIKLYPNIFSLSSFEKEKLREEVDFEDETKFTVGSKNGSRRLLVKEIFYPFLMIYIITAISLNPASAQSNLYVMVPNSGGSYCFPNTIKTLGELMEGDDRESMSCLPTSLTSNMTSCNVYCRQFPWNCLGTNQTNITSSTALCWCEILTLQYLVSYESEGNIFSQNEIVMVPYVISSNVTLPPINTKRKTLSDIFCPTILANLNEKVLYAQLSSQCNGLMLISKSIYRKIVLINSLELYHHMDERIFDDTGIVEIEFYCENHLCDSKQFKIEGKEQCTEPDGLFDSLFGVGRFSCASGWKQVYILTTAFTSIALLITICFISYLCLRKDDAKCCFSVPYRIVKYSGDKVKKSKIGSAFGGAMSDRVKNVKNIYLSGGRVKDEELDSYDEESGLDSQTVVLNLQTKQNENFTSKKKRFGKGKPVLLSYGLIALMIISCLAQNVSSQCSDSPIISVTGTVCTQINNQQQSCAVQMNTIQTLPFPGYQTCMNLVLNNETLAIISIVYVNAVDHMTTSTDYYTAAFTGSSQYSHGCYDTDICPGQCDTCCTDRSAGGALSSPLVVNAPGRSRCDRSCGCVTCGGCLFCDASCLYSGYGLNPTGKVYQVSSMIQRKRVPEIFIKIQYSNGTIAQAFALIGTPATFNGITVSIQGNLIQTLSDFGADKLVTFGTTESYIGPASLKNQPQLENIGDIQAVSPQKFSSLSHDSFIFDPSIATYSDAGTSASYSFAQSGVGIIDTLLTRLPATIAGNIWSVTSQGQFQGVILDPGAISIIVTSPGNLNVVKVNSLICPKIINCTSATGCKNCNQGANFWLTAYSTCSPGIATIHLLETYASLNTPGVSLTANPSQFLISLSTTMLMNDLHFTLNANGGSDSCEIIFEAPDNVTLRNDTVSQSSGTGSNNNSIGSATNFGDFWNDFFNSANGLWWILRILFLIIAIAIVLALIYPIYNYCLKGGSKPKRS